MDKTSRTVRPPSPCFYDIGTATIRDLALLYEFCDGLSEAALLFLNKPRAVGSAAEFAENFLSETIFGWMDIARREIQSRTPQNVTDAELRAEVLIRDWALDGRFADIAELAASVAGEKAPEN